MKRALMVLVVAAVAVGLVTSPASAQTKVRKDKVGDAPANVDIRSVKVQNNARDLALTVRFQTVQGRRTAVVASFFPGGIGDLGDVDAPLTVYVLSSVPVSGGRHATRLVRVHLDDLESPDGGVEQQVRCPGLTSRWKRGTRGFARIVVPQSCLGADAGRQTAGVTSFDKRLIALNSAVRESLRGDLTDDDIRADFVPSLITTRRG